MQGLSRTIMFCFMVNAMVLGFLSSMHASAQASGMVLICGPNGITAISLEEEKPGDLSLIDRERCITSCLAMATGTPGLIGDTTQIILPQMRFEPPRPDVQQAPAEPVLAQPRARGPPFA